MNDCNIYGRKPVAGARVMRSVTRFLKQTLKLKVHEEKRAVAGVDERLFLAIACGKTGRLPWLRRVWSA